MLRGEKDESNKTIAAVTRIAPRELDAALIELIERLSGVHPTIIAWIVICEMLYPRSHPNHGISPPKTPLSLDVSLGKFWKKWSKIVDAVKIKHPMLQDDAWRKIFGAFQTNPLMTVEEAIGLADVEARLQTKPKRPKKKF